MDRAGPYHAGSMAIDNTRSGSMKSGGIKSGAVTPEAMQRTGNRRQ